MGPKKIMVIGAQIPAVLVDALHATSLRVTQVPDGKTAIQRAQREMFDSAVLVSTGDEMDLSETIFNLSDISRAMELIIVSGQQDRGGSAVPEETLVGVVPNTKMMTPQDVKKYFRCL
jgi:hypothetical protein